MLEEEEQLHLVLRDISRSLLFCTTLVGVVSLNRCKKSLFSSLCFRLISTLQVRGAGEIAED